MPRCNFCGKNVPLPFHCQYCGRSFCDEHRLPPNHACAGLAEWKKTPAPGVGIRYGSGGASAYGGGYAAAPKGKKSSRVPVWKHPYFRIAIVAIMLLIIVILFILMGGCVQPGGIITANAGTATETPAGTQTPSVPVAPPAITTASPATLPTPGLTPDSHRSEVTPALPIAGTSADTTPFTPAAVWETTVTTVSPSFTPVVGKLSDDPYTIQTDLLADRIHELINTHRAAYGLAPLSTDAALATIALGHSTDMAENNYFSHTDLAGGTPTDRGNASGYTCIKNYSSYYTYGIAENIFQNNLYSSVTYENGVYTYAWSTPEEIAQSTVTGWMNSEGHKRNILTMTFDREGLGVAIAADDKVYITEDFC